MELVKEWGNGEGCKLYENTKHVDERGYFEVVYNKDWLQRLGINLVQINQSFSIANGTLRGLHFQTQPNEQGKLVRCVKGKLFDAAVDLRRDSPTYLEATSIVLSEEDDYLFWIPRGFAHGFLTLQENTRIEYLVDGGYSAQDERSVIWSDPTFSIDWPIKPSILSSKDKSAQTWQDQEYEVSFRM